MRILFISRWFPYPPDNGSRIRVYNLLKSLSARHCLHLISFTDDMHGALNAVQHLRGWVEQIELVPYRPFQPRRKEALAGFLSPYPRSMVDTFSFDMKDQVEIFIKSNNYDIVIGSQIDIAPYLRDTPHPCIVLEELELTGAYDRFVKAGSGYRKFRAGLTWLKLSRYVSGFPGFIRGVTVVSQQEKKQVESILKGALPVRVVPNGIDCEYYRGDFGDTEAHSLVYAGALTYGANFDAVAHFLTTIYPLIQSEIPQVKLYITGKLDGVPLERLPKLPGVIFTGYLPDIRPRVAQSWVSVVPLRVGGGTRLKILESLALSTPVVATSKGAEGLELNPGVDLLIADQPADFAQKVICVLRDRDLRDKLGLQGRKAVNERYNWANIGDEFNQFIEELARGKKGLRGDGIN